MSSLQCASTNTHIFALEDTNRCFPPVTKIQREPLLFVFCERPCVHQKKKKNTYMHVRDKIRIELYLFLGIYKERDCMYTRKEETYSYICGKMYIHFNCILGHMQCSSTFPKSAKIYAYIWVTSHFKAYGIQYVSCRANVCIWDCLVLGHVGW